MILSVLGFSPRFGMVSVKFAQVANEVVSEVRELGPAKYFIKNAQR